MMSNDKGITIMRFTGLYRFLSNFWPVEIEFEGDVYGSVENAYQAAKFPKEARGIFKNISPGEAKNQGRLATLSPNWEDSKVDIMFGLLQQKFQVPDLKQKLLETRDYFLIEGNTWGDTFWGINLQTGEGQNLLGQLLTKIRDDLRREK